MPIVEISDTHVAQCCPSCSKELSVPIADLRLGTDTAPDRIVLPACSSCGAVETLFVCRTPAEALLADSSEAGVRAVNVRRLGYALQEAGQHARVYVGQEPLERPETPQAVPTPGLASDAPGEPVEASTGRKGRAR